MSIWCVFSVTDLLLRSGYMPRWKDIMVLKFKDNFSKYCTFFSSFSALKADRLAHAQICKHVRVRLQPAGLSNLSHYPAGMNV